MLQRAKIMWDDNLVIQCLSDEMEFAVTYSIPDVSFDEELWISKVSGASGLLRPQTLPGGYLKLNFQGLIVRSLLQRDASYWDNHREIVS